MVLSPQNGKRIGPFQVLEKLGEGGERVVFKAICEDPVAGIQKGETVALCCLQDREPKAFDRETRILSTLDHPHILRYRHSFAAATLEDPGGLCCLVTEYLDGRTLKVVLGPARGDRPPHWTQVRDWFVEILGALDYACERGVVHRDIKPTNIFVTRGGSAKLIDFGIARFSQDGEEAECVTEIRGSWDYMAPDFVRQAGFSGDHLSDIFSLGVSMVEVLTGELPFETLGAVGAAVAFQKRWDASAVPPRPRLRHPIFRLLPGLRDLMSRCLDLDRAKRPLSFSEIRRKLVDLSPPKIPGSDADETYEHVEFLGEGGFGEVFKALRRRGSETRGYVAVKHLKASATCHLDAQSRARFEREADLLRSLRHPHLVTCIDLLKLESPIGIRHCLVLEHLSGMPEAGLRARIARSREGIDAGEVLTLFDRYLDALGFLHRQNIIHRDIKPHNLYAPEGRPDQAKVFDLGIALDLDSADKTSGPVPGSWDYMAPEFVSPGHGRGTPHSDLYSMGVSLYQALTGSLPYARIASAAEFCRHASSPPPVRFTHPVFREYPALREVVARFLAPRPGDRYQNTTVARDALRRVLDLGDAGETAMETGAVTQAELTRMGSEMNGRSSDGSKSHSAKRWSAVQRTVRPVVAAVAAVAASIAVVQFRGGDARAAAALHRGGNARPEVLVTSEEGRKESLIVQSGKESRPAASTPTLPTGGSMRSTESVASVPVQSGGGAVGGSHAKTDRVRTDLGYLRALGEDALDRELMALLIWYGLRENSEGVQNPAGYQPQRGQRSEKLVNTSRARWLPSASRVEALEARFQKAGKLTPSNRAALAALLRASGRTGTR